MDCSTPASDEAPGPSPPQPSPSAEPDHPRNNWKKAYRCIETTRIRKVVLHPSLGSNEISALAKHPTTGELFLACCDSTIHIAQPYQLLRPLQPRRLAGQPFHRGDDDGLTSDARFSSVTGLLWHPTAAALFVADFDNLAIRKIENGTVSTFLSTYSKPVSLAMEPQTGDLIIGCIYPSCILRVPLAAPDDVSFINNFDNGAVFTGYVAFSAQLNAVVWTKVNTVWATSLEDFSFTLIAGDPTATGTKDGYALAEAEFANLQAIAVDSTGAIFVTEWETGLRRIANGRVTTLAGPNAQIGQNVSLEEASSLALDEQQGLAFVADTARVALLVYPL